MKVPILLTTAIVLSLPVVYADSGSSELGKSSQDSSLSSSRSSPPQDVRLSKLLEASVVSKSGENLGKLEDLALNPKSGKIDYVILGRGGILGIGEKRVPVPWQAVNITSEKQFMVNVDKNKLKSAPTVDKQLSGLDQPEEYVTIYRFYEIPVDTGAAETQGGSQSGGASSSGSQGGASGSVSGSASSQDSSSSQGSSSSPQSSSSSGSSSSAQPQSTSPK
jgi:sporulation protein YlmC with PRC-barrel domain